MSAPESRRLARRLLVASLIVWAAAAALYGTRVMAFGERPAYIHIRWAPSVDDAARGAEERKYRLRSPVFQEGRTWGYALTDVSRVNVTALVNDPSVEDTHNINRIKFRPGLFTPRLPYETRAPWIPNGLNVLSAFFVLAGMFATGLAVLEIAAPALLRERRRALIAVVLDPRPACRHGASRLISWLSERIPPVSAEAAAAFRIVFGITVLIVLLNRAVPAAWAAAPQNPVTGFQSVILRMFAETPSIAGWIRPWLMAWGLLFIAGAMTRTSFAMMTIGALAWGVLYTTRVTHHAVSALLMTLIFLQWSRWGDAWSVDAWRRGSPPPPGKQRRYGYPVWIPSLVLGVVLAAASVAKLRESGLGWILNGTVKYHFVSDATQAPVDWGLRVGQHPWLAVALSFGAIVIESLVIVGVLSRSYRYRLAAGVATLSLLVGFELFQGLWWPAWWILLLSFLPWHLVGPHATPELAASPGSMRRPALAILAIAVVQIVVSTLKLEVRPVLSTYDMYATTYESEADYASKAGVAYWVVAQHADGTTHECHVGAIEAGTVSLALASAAPSKASSEVLDICFASSGAPITRVSVEGRRRTVDWRKWPPAEFIATPVSSP